MFKSEMLILFLAVALMAGCGPLGALSVTGSGNVVTQEEAITGFDRIEISQGFTADISQADAFSVAVHADDNLVQYLRVVKKDSVLRIGLDPTRNYQDATLKAEVTMPQLIRLTLRHGSHATASGSGAKVKLTVEAFDGSGADLSAFTVEEATVKASGGSQVTVNVSGSLVADASQGSKIFYLGSTKSVTTNESGGAQIRPK